MECPNCGVVNALGLDRCAHCGNALVEKEGRAAPERPAGSPATVVRLSTPLQRLAALLVDILLVNLVLAPVAELQLVRAQGPAGQLLLFAALVLYFGFCEQSRSRATVGKRLLGLHVEGLERQRLTFRRSLLRALVKLLCLTPLALPLSLLVLFRADQRGLHDLVVGSRVVRDE